MGISLTQETALKLQALLARQETDGPVEAYRDNPRETPDGGALYFQVTSLYGVQSCGWGAAKRVDLVDPLCGEFVDTVPAEAGFVVVDMGVLDTLGRGSIPQGTYFEGEFRGCKEPLPGRQADDPWAYSFVVIKRLLECTCASESSSPPPSESSPPPSESSPPPSESSPPPSESSPSGSPPSGSPPSGSSESQPSGSSESQPSGSPPSGSPPSQPSGSPPSGSPPSGGSDKSTAIVPASWSPTGYTALFIAEMPNVRFDDVIKFRNIKQEYQELEVDPRYLEVCEAGTVDVVSVVPSEPVVVGAEFENGRISLKFADPDPNLSVSVTIRLSAIRKGFGDQTRFRFPNRTERQFIANEEFLNSAYPAE